MHPAATRARNGFALPSISLRLMCGECASAGCAAQACSHGRGLLGDGRPSVRRDRRWPVILGHEGLPASLPLLDRGSGAVYQWLMIGPAKIYFIIFGLLTIVGGVIGYVKAGSTASIVAGAVSGIALMVAAYLLPGNVALGLIIAGVVSVALAGKFIPDFMKTGKVMPAGLMAILSVIGVIVAIVAWIKK